MNKPAALTMDFNYLHSMLIQRWYYDEGAKISRVSNDIPPKLTMGFQKTDNSRRSNQNNPNI